MATLVHHDGLGSAVALEATTAKPNTAYVLDPDGAAHAVSERSATPKNQFLTDDGHGTISTVTSPGGAVDCAARFDMRGFENQVRAALDAGQVVNYGVTPIYRGTGLMPIGITLRAQGSGGLDFFLSVLNKGL